MFRFLMAAIDFDGIAQRLKGVEGQTDREDDRETVKRVIPANKFCKHRQVLIGKIEIFEESQHTDVGQDAGDQDPALFTSLKSFQPQPRKIIYCNRHRQNENIFWNEGHIEVTTGRQQKHPAKSMWN